MDFVVTCLSKIAEYVDSFTMSFMPNRPYEVCMYQENKTGYYPIILCNSKIGIFFQYHSNVRSIYDRFMMYNGYSSELPIYYINAIVEGKATLLDFYDKDGKLYFCYSDKVMNRI